MFTKQIASKEKFAFFNDAKISDDCLLRDIKSRVNKNKGNIKHYNEKKKGNERKKKNRNSSFESEDDEDDEKDKENTSHGDGEVL